MVSGGQAALLMLVAGAMSAAIIAFMLRTGRVGPIDQPNHRSLHQTPVPRSGGLGILAGLSVGWLVWIPPLPWLVAICLLALVSWWDDRFPLPAHIRLAAHFLAASLVVITAPLMTEGWGGMLLLILALVWMINLYNFMDGANGLSGGMAVVGFSAYAVMAWFSGQSDLGLWAAVTVGAALGFLLFNFDPARIFMGDVGSVPLGFMAMLLGLEGWLRSVWPVWFPVLVFSPFIVDASVTLTRRALHGEKIWLAHRDHYYQRLVRSGWSHRKLSLYAYGVMLLVAVSALTAATLSVPLQWSILGLWGFVYLAIFRAIDRHAPMYS